jgi:hypothetical protein
MSLLTGDVTASPLREAGGVLPAARPAADPRRLASFQADPAPWRERLLAAARYLDAPPGESRPGSPR